MKKFKLRAYQVTLRDRPIGRRVVSFRRGRRIMNWLRRRGHCSELRYFGEIFQYPDQPVRGFA